MKAKDLIAKLRGLDPEADVICCSEDEELKHSDSGFRILDIIDVASQEAERIRLEDGTPYLKLGKTPSSSPQAIIDVTIDF